MSLIVILLIVVATLFAGAFISKRRFGLLGLGLAAGAIISPIWGDTAGYVLSGTGLVKEGPLVNAIALSILILIPPVLIMFHRGYGYKHIFGRIIGAFLFTFLAVAFLIGPIGSALSFSGPVAGAYNWLVANHELIVSIGVAIALADLLIAKPSHKSEKKHR